MKQQLLYTGLNVNSIKVTVDGAAVPGATCTLNGTITVPNVKLSNGTHTIRIEIADEQGNIGSYTKKLTVNTPESDVRLELADPNYANLPTGSIMYFNLVADDINNIQSVTTKINLDGLNTWELIGMTTAYGFSSTFTVNDNNDATITITRTGAAIDDSTNVLAQLPVRVYITNSYLDPDFIASGYVSNDVAKQDKYWVLTPDAMWLTDGVFVVRLQADASEGVVTYTDGTQSTFSSNMFDISTELNRYRNSIAAGTTSINQDKASFHIHTAGEPTDKAATCTEAGYTGRVFCVGCSCRTVELNGHECDNADGCGSVIEWGTVVPATGHNYALVDGKLVCACGEVKELGTGLFEVNGKPYYSIGGKLVAGWKEIDGEYYYFDATTYTAVETYNNGYVTFSFEANGKLVSGQWYHTAAGSRYYYGPDYYKGRNVGDIWAEIDGKQYCFPKSGYVKKGYNFFSDGYAEVYTWYDFGTDGAMISKLGDYTGVMKADGQTYCVVDGVSKYGMHYMDGAYYYCAGTAFAAVTNIERYCPKTNGVLPVGTYRFGADGKMLNNVVCNVDGVLYYFVLGKVSQGEGTVTINETVCNIAADGKVDFTGECTDASGQTLTYVNGVHTYIPKNGIYEENGRLYYYENDVKVQKGLVKTEDGDYYYFGLKYYAVSNGTFYFPEEKMNGMLPGGTYEVDADGKVIIP